MTSSSIRNPTVPEFVQEVVHIHSRVMRTQLSIRIFKDFSTILIIMFHHLVVYQSDMATCM